MTITLTIDNIDSLPDGGPIRFQARNRGFEIGREQHLDWTLPDPGRFISGRHCEVRYENGGYWLYDTSTNGVFVNGSAQRVKSPYRLDSGERISIGHYIIHVVVALEEEQAQAASTSSDATPAPSSGGDIWSLDEPAPTPVDRRDFMPPAARRREADFSNQFLEFPDIQPPLAPVADRSEASVWSIPSSEPPVRPEPEPFAPPPARPANLPTPDFMAPREQAPVSPVVVARPLPGPAERPLPGVRVERVAAPPMPLAAPAAGGDRLFLDAFAAGAGISPDAVRGRDPLELAREIGEFVQLAVDNLRQLLQARAAAKTMTKSASRTMISASDNNPLKFIPGTAEAIEVMFAHNRPGYLHSGRSLDDGFSDLKRHDLATYTAMQKALAKLVDDFAPESFEQKAGASAFASKKGRAWELFVAKWAERNAGENGMLDAFLAYFAEAYDEASRRK